MEKRRVEAGILLRFALVVYQFQLDCGTTSYRWGQPWGRLRSLSPAVLEDLHSRCAADSVKCPAMLCKVVLQGIARQRLREGRGLPRSASTAEAED